MRQLFYVLGGELMLELEGVVKRLAKGEALELTLGAAHQARNETMRICDFR